MDHQRVTVRFECESAGDVLVRKLTAREALNELFSYELELVVLGDGSFDPSPLLGERASVSFERDGLVVRTVRGQLVEVRKRRAHEVDATSFGVRLAPHAEQLRLYETQEVFLDLSVPEIIQRKLNLVGLEAHVELRRRNTYPTREFVVQYKESDFAFVSRLAEHVGISYFFEHDDEHDKIVFTDVAGFPRRSEPIAFLGRGDQKGGVWQLDTRSRMIPGVYVEQEWNYRTPGVELTSSHESPLGMVGGVVEFGAHYKTPEEGTALAQLRARERESQHTVHEGESDQAELEPGHIVDLDGDALLVLEVTHTITQGVGLHGDSGATRYANRFRAIDASVHYAPPRKTPCPRIFGVTSGIIVDAQGSEAGDLAHIDEHGRYLTRFLFDTAGSGERRASRPIRMAQPLAGQGYGVHFPLRPGIEVLIAFVDGDPDRPVIVGSVPNHVTPSPVTQPNLVQSRILTQSGILIQLQDR